MCHFPTENTSGCVYAQWFGWKRVAAKMSKPLAIWFEFSAKYANRLNITFRDMDQTDFFMAEKKTIAVP